MREVGGKERMYEYGTPRRGKNNLKLNWNNCEYGIAGAVTYPSQCVIAREYDATGIA